MSTADLVTIQNLTFYRGTRKIFDDVTLSVPKGKITAIIEYSGIGKTTLLRLIGDKFTLIMAMSSLMAIIFLAFLDMHCTKRVRK